MEAKIICQVGNWAVSNSASGAGYFLVINLETGVNQRVHGLAAAKELAVRLHCGTAGL